MKELINYELIFYMKLFITILNANNYAFLFIVQCMYGTSMLDTVFRTQCTLRQIALMLL